MPYSFASAYVCGANLQLTGIFCVGIVIKGQKLFGQFIKDEVPAKKTTCAQIVANTKVTIFVYLLILAFATSPPSFIIFSSDGIIKPSNCITIDAVIYGVIDIAKIDNLEKAPPDIVSIKPAKLDVDDCICSAIANESTPGTTI